MDSYLHGEEEAIISIKDSLAMDIEKMWKILNKYAVIFKQSSLLIFRVVASILWH